MPENNNGTGIPRVGEIVLARISKIMPFGAYCKLIEYNNTEAFLPIKEISSGWIKNIHEFVHEGQQVVCKVIFYDRVKATIDISLKKTTTQESKQKLNSYNLEKRLGALFMQAIRQSKLESHKDALNGQLLSTFGTYTGFMHEVVGQTRRYEELDMPKKLKESISALLESTKKKKHFVVSYIMKLSTFNTKSGASELRSILSAIKEGGIDVQYISAPKYHMTAEGTDYADAEGKIQKVADIVNSRLKKGVFEIAKEKLKREKEDILSTL